jgi:hypothetical protein
MSNQIKRSVAAQLIDGIMQDIASFKDIQTDPWRNDNLGEIAIDTLNRIENKLNDAGLILLELCNGEAHTNPHIDYCMRCAPRFGYIGEKVVVK